MSQLFAFEFAPESILPRGHGFEERDAIEEAADCIRGNSLRNFQRGTSNGSRAETPNNPFNPISRFANQVHRVAVSDPRRSISLSCMSTTSRVP